MTQQTILTDLKLESNYYLAKPYAAKLLSLFKLINELEKMEGFKCELKGQRGNVELVNELPELKRGNFNEWWQYDEAKRKQDNCRNIYGLFEQWQLISISHAKGCYSFPFPMNNRLYNVFLGLAGEVVVNEQKESKKEVCRMLLFNSDTVMDSIRKAAKFVSKDDLRPAMECVCLDFTDGKLQVVSTDAHRMYLSKNTDVQMWVGEIPAKEFKPFRLLLEPESVKILVKSKVKKDEVYISLFNDNTALINGIEVKIFTDGKFPDFRVVIPEYDSFMKFDKDEFVKNVKQVLPFAKSSTQQVALHLNGSIALHTEDTGWNNDRECDREMPYISKNFKDTDIGFNGKFLIEACGIFKDKTLKMYSEGIATRAVLISNDVEDVLLMPLMLNS